MAVNLDAMDCIEARPVLLSSLTDQYSVYDRAQYQNAHNTQRCLNHNIGINAGQEYDYNYSPYVKRTSQQFHTHPWCQPHSQSSTYIRTLDSNPWGLGRPAPYPLPSLTGTVPIFDFPQQMFGANNEVLVGGWKPQGPDISSPVKDAQEWDCPSLVDGEEDTSPTTSLDSWAPFTPPALVDYKPLLTDDLAIVSSNEHSITGTFGSRETTLPMGNGPDAHYDVSLFASSIFDSHPDFDYWQWSRNGAARECHWMLPSTVQTMRPSAVESALCSGANTGPYIPYDSVSTSRKMPAPADIMAPALTSDTPHAHVVPGLLFKVWEDGHASPRAISEVSTVPDRDLVQNQASTSSSPQCKKEIIPSHDDGSLDDHDANGPQLSTPVTTEARTGRDHFLLQSRRDGLSYKEIKRRGGFTEAESTLRGRIRILSKPKHERVRKPHWHHDDLTLLRRAVSSFAPSSPHHQTTSSSQSHRLSRQSYYASPKLPWKKISEWLGENGASYPFAPATCAKKWEQIRDVI